MSDNNGRLAYENGKCWCDNPHLNTNSDAEIAWNLGYNRVETGKITEFSEYASLIHRESCIKYCIDDHVKVVLDMLNLIKNPHLLKSYADKIIKK